MRLQFGELNITPSVVERLHELDFTVPELQDAIDYHRSRSNDHPAVYVGTYGKYTGALGYDNNLQGLWVDLTTFDDYDEFINFCEAIHSDEIEPELQFQDFENFPRQWYHESCLSEDDFFNIQEYWKMCEQYSIEAIEDFMEFNDDLSDFEEAYCGHWDDEEDFARHIVEECYDIEKSMGSLAQYFDYEHFARDLFLWDYNMGANNNVFRRV